MSEQLVTILIAAGFGVYWMRRLLVEKRLREERARKTEQAKQLELEKDRAPQNRNEVYARYLRQCSDYKTAPLPREDWDKARDEQMKSGGLYWHA